jgi:hypothetical protein
VVAVLQHANEHQRYLKELSSEGVEFSATIRVENRKAGLHRLGRNFCSAPSDDIDFAVNSCPNLFAISKFQSEHVACYTPHGFYGPT